VMSRLHEGSTNLRKPALKKHPYFPGKRQKACINV
jgi:hypothetical protein